MSIDLNEYYMQVALKEAEVAFENDEVPVGAVIVHEKKIIAKAHNQIRQLKDPTAHAEILAITQASNILETERLLETTIYVTLEPCVMCAGALVLARIKKLVYAASDPKAGACGTLYNIVQDSRLNHRLQIEKGLFSEKSSTLLQAFFKKKRSGEVPKRLKGRVC